MKENTSVISMKENIRDRKTTKEKDEPKKSNVYKKKSNIKINKRSRYRSHK